MNGLGEVQEYIKNFVCEKEQLQRQINEIEEQRTQLAQQRNETKKINNSLEAVNELGKQIAELGNKSQELQNSLDFKSHAVKAQINLVIDNLVAEGIRKIRLINEEINQLQEKETEKSILEIQVLREKVGQIEDEITVLARTKRDFKNGNLDAIIGIEEETEEIYIEELKIEEIEPIEELHVEEFGSIEELYVEEFKPMEELSIEEFKEVEEAKTETVYVEENAVEEIENLAKSIVEQIIFEQTKDIITFEQEEEKKTKAIIPLFGQRATISNITIKFEDGNLVYKAQMSDDEEIKIYPSKLGEESVLLRDKQNREECKEILINFAIREYRVLDKKVVNKIDPLVCELLIECAETYGYDAQELIYNYAMSFSEGELENVPEIVYNFSCIEQSNLNKKEKIILNKICRNARKNNKIQVIEPFSGFKKFKYIFKRLFAINNIKVLPEAKY